MEDENMDYYDEDEYDEVENIDQIDEDIVSLMKNYEETKKNYRASHKITKYEKSRIIAERSTMLSNNAKSYIDKPERYMNTYDLALAEFNEGKLPFIIKRKYGNQYEYWKLADLL